MLAAIGRVRYVGCSTHLGHGRSMEGFMGVHFTFAYVLRPSNFDFSLKEALNAHLSLD